MLTSGNAEKITPGGSDEPVELIPAGHSRTLRFPTIVNTSSVPALFSINGVDYGYLPAEFILELDASAVPPHDKPILVKRLPGGTDVTGLWAFAL